MTEKALLSETKPDAWLAYVLTISSTLHLNQSHTMATFFRISMSFIATDSCKLCKLTDLICVFHKIHAMNHVFFPYSDRIPRDRPIWYANFVATHECLSPQENVIAVTFMENEIIRMAKELNCAGVISVNTSELTQQLGEHVFGYKTLFDIQVNQFQIDGRRPFATVPDSVHTLVQFKTL